GSLSAILDFGCFRALQSKNWPVADGVVVSFQENPNYRYSAGGKSYASSRVSCNEFVYGPYSITNGERMVELYPLGAKVLVHYDPQNPASAVLETKFDPSMLAAPAILSVLTIFCAIGFQRGWRFKSWRLTLP